MRKLASIQKIISVDDIPGYDRIGLAKSQGWQFVVDKSQFAPGDLFIYVEYDSIFPKEHPLAEHWAFMEKHKYRVKTIRFRGIMSQGVALPINILDGEFQEGDEVTELLGITKYEPQVEMVMGDRKIYSFPSFIPKTDETRIQSCLGVLDEINGQPAVATMKLDGSSATYFVKNYHLDVRKYFGICSRTVMQSGEWVPNTSTMKTEVNPYHEMAEKYKLREKFTTTPDNFQYAVQGEICGPGMDGSGTYKNPLGLSERHFYVFNVYDISNSKYLDFEAMLTFCHYFDLEHVPILYKWESAKFDLEFLLELAKGKYPGTNNHREGIVIRPQIELYSPTLHGRLSFKVINNDYLLAEK